jgi:NRPS condensation-like uncharacterized protein
MLQENNMKKHDKKRYLQDYAIYGRRKTTINHAFSSAISISDNYDEDRINKALEVDWRNELKR